MKVDDVIRAYILLRDQRDTLKKRHAEELKKPNEDLYKLQLWLQRQLQQTGQTSAKTEAGTAFLQTDTSVTVEDFDATLAFIQTNGLWPMLEKRVSKSVVTDYISSTGEIPPGVKVTSEISCHVRRS